MEGVSIERARAAKSEVMVRVASIPQVNGVGLARIDHGYAVKVNLSEPLERISAIPSEVNGVPILIDIVGSIVARK